MRLSKICIPLLAWSLCTAPVPAQEPAAQEPRETDLVERAERRLIQLDVSFEAKRRALEGAVLPRLEPADFELNVNAKQIDIRYADRICRVDTREVVTEESEAIPAAPAVTGPVSTYIFYLEHKLLTMRGQNIALEMLEEMVEELVVDGNRGMIVSSGGSVLQSPFSTEPSELLGFLEEVRGNPRQWTEFQYAQTEDERHRQIREQPTTGGQQIAARAYQLEEMRITTNRFNRLAALIGGLSEVDPPKALFYFADIARKDPGKHFADLFSNANNFSLSTGFDQVLREANAQGVRLYSIQAQGIQPASTAARGISATDQGVEPGLGEAQNAPLTGLRRMEEAENTLRSFSAETGGEMFFGGNDASTMRRIVKTIERDFNCFYLLSFPADGLPEDGLMRVAVKLNPDTENGAAADRDYRLQTRGQLVVQSESSRTESKLLAAHLTTAATEDNVGRGGVIPLGYRGGKFEALIQFVVQSPPLPPGIVRDSLWDLGMTKLAGTDVEGDVSGRVGSDSPAAPVILETRWKFEPGDYSVMSVGHEKRLGQVATAKLDLEWPDPNKSRLSVSPIAAVQPYDGAFLKKDGSRESSELQGPIALGESPALIDRPLALVGLVCRGKRMKDDVWVVRELTGGSTVEFPPIRWEFDGERCVHLRDVLKNGQLGWGDFVYDIKVFDNEAMTGEPAASRRIEFSAADVEQPSGGNSTS